MNTGTRATGPRIYNLFPLLAGPLTTWTSHFERIRQLGFDWVFINPFHQSGYSGSLYAIKDHYTIDPRLIDPEKGAPRTQLEHMIHAAERLGLKLMMDFVINHTAFDSLLLKEHPQWYKRGADGKPVHPSAKEDDHVVTWGDLYEIDNAGSPDRTSLWSYWLRLAKTYAGMGFRGFRCDAAYKVPTDLWRFLLGQVKQAYPGTQFFAESLGCPSEETLRLARTGFDFIFNSSKWWDFSAPWCLTQYRETAPFVPSISFPESHDTARLAAELHGDQQAVKLRYAFAALFSTGVMMPMGFEYGFRRRLDVVKMRPTDWEEPQWDLSAFVSTVNQLKASRRVFNEEGEIEPIDVGNHLVCAFVKWSQDRRERAVVLLNKDPHHLQYYQIGAISPWLQSVQKVEDISFEGRMHVQPGFALSEIQPSGIQVLYAQ